MLNNNYNNNNNNCKKMARTKTKPGVSTIVRIEVIELKLAISFITAAIYNRFGY